MPGKRLADHHRKDDTVVRLRLSKRQIVKLLFGGEVPFDGGDFKIILEGEQ